MHVYYLLLSLKVEELTQLLIQSMWMLVIFILGLQLEEEVSAIFEILPHFCSGPSLPKIAFWLLISFEKGSILQAVRF